MELNYDKASKIFFWITSHSRDAFCGNFCLVILFFISLLLIKKLYAPSGETGWGPVRQEEKKREA